MSHIVDNIYNNILKKNLIDYGDKVLIALSGGADSVFLLNVLYEIKKHMNFEIGCAHLNHGIRGAQADYDQKFCADLCESMNVALYTKKCNIPELAKKNKLSEETCGRKERYAFFDDICSKHGFNKIAVAHNMNDCVETTLINMIRGASLNGLCGIDEKNNNIIRPILNISREEIEAYLCSKNISFCTDSTNLTTDYTRNKVRHEILSKMKEINNSVISTVYTNSLNLKDDNDFLNEYSDELKCIFHKNNDVYINKKIFDKQHIAIKKRLLIKSFSELNGNSMNIASNHLDILTQELKPGSMYNMPHNTSVYISSDYLIFSHVKLDETVSEMIFEPGKTITFGNGIKVSSKFVAKTDYSKSDCIYIDYDSLKSETLYLRSKKDGDKIIPFGMKSSKKIKQLFTELKIPINIRNSVPILCDKEHIIAVIPYRICEFHKIKENTKSILKIQLIREDVQNVNK